MSRRLRGTPQEAGFSLTELMVVVTLMGIVGAVVAAATTTGLHKQTQVQDRTDTMAQARTALQRIGRDVRSTSGIVVATDTMLQLNETQTSTSWTVTYQLQADGSTYDLTAVRSDQPGVTTILLKNLVNITTSPVFKYGVNPNYSPTGTTVDTSTCAIAGTSPTQYGQSCIGTVYLHLNIQPSTLSQPIDMSDNGTELRNAS
jgi:prepilin-type N-terminal cleavage/methylation domain-containing protein